MEIVTICVSLGPILIPMVKNVNVYCCDVLRQPVRHKIVIKNKHVFFLYAFVHAMTKSQRTGPNPYEEAFHRALEVTTSFSTVDPQDFHLSKPFSINHIIREARVTES